MALKVFDGFDHYAADTDMSSRSGFLQWNNVISNTSFVTGRNGFGLAMYLPNASAGFSATFGQRVASAFVGFALNLQSGTGCIFEFIDSLSGLVQVTVVFDSLSFAVRIYRGPVNTGTLLYSSANNVWAAGVYNYLEIWPVIDPSAGSVTVDVNGVTVASISSANTRNSTNSTWDVLSFASQNAGTFLLDDLYYADTTTGPGTYPCDSFLGDSRVDTLFATGNDAVQWTPLANQNWQEVASVQFDGDSAYNYTTTPTDQDTYTFGVLSGTITLIYGVQVTTAQRKDDSSARSTKSVVKISSTDYFGTTNSLPNTTYTYFTDLWILNPNTTANWTSSDVNGATYGIQCVS